MRSITLALLVVATACGNDASSLDAGIPMDGSRDAVGSDVGNADASASSQRLEIGTGLTDFEPIPEGGEVELVMGPQGGWHIEIATRLYGMDPMDLNLRIRGFDAETNEPLTIVVERVLTTRRVRDEGDHYLRLGDQLVFTVEDGSLVVGKQVRVEADATPVGGMVAHAEKTVLIVDRMP